MTIEEAVLLIDTGYINPNNKISTWADLGCGKGLFTMALASLIPGGSTIYAIDKNNSLTSRVTANGVKVVTKESDFVTDELTLQNLDGILMANSLHYVKDKPEFLQKIKSYLKPEALFLIVEYDTDVPVARWVPYPLGFLSMTTLFNNAGYKSIRKLGERPSVYGRGNMYASLISK